MVAAAMVGAAVVGGVASTVSANKQASAVKDANAAQIEANKPDPRVQAMLYGANGDNGLLSRYQGMLDTPQSDAMKGYGKAAGDYLGNYGADNATIRGAAGSLMTPQGAPQAQAASAGSAALAPGVRVKAPSQNGLDLNQAYQGMIYGDPAANPYLTGAIGKGIDQSQNAFNTMQDSATRNLMQNVLPSIRSNSVLAGQYGGSRQGIAEGNAIGDFARAQQQQIGQFGQGNTDAAVAAQAGAFDAGQNRALSATQGLGAQQYGVASQDASMDMQRQLANKAAINDLAKTNAGFTQQSSLANAQFGLANNQANSNNLLAGTGLLSGLTTNAASVAGAQDAYDLSKASQVNGLLSPYLSKNGTPTQLTPLYQNQAGNALGGALAGAQLGGQLYNLGASRNWFGGTPPSQNLSMPGEVNYE